MKKTLGEIAHIDSRKAARVVHNRFAHDLINGIARYRAVIYKADKIVTMIYEMGA